MSIAATLKTCHKSIQLGGSYFSSLRSHTKTNAIAHTQALLKRQYAPGVVEVRRRTATVSCVYYLLAALAAKLYHHFVQTEITTVGLPSRFVQTFMVPRGWNPMTSVSPSLELIYWLAPLVHLKRYWWTFGGLLGWLHWIVVIMYHIWWIGFILFLTFLIRCLVLGAWNKTKRKMPCNNEKMWFQSWPPGDLLRWTVWQCRKLIHPLNTGPPKLELETVIIHPCSSGPNSSHLSQSDLRVSVSPGQM